MGILDIGNADASSLKTTQKDYSVASENTDGTQEQKETEWINTKWTQYLGYYKQIPELSSVIDAIATWTVGKGFKSDEVTELILDTFNGWGKDTFNTIIENMIRTYHIGGDAFAEIVRDEENNIINLKTLDPGTIKIVTNKKGIIIRYEQITKGSGNNKRKEPETILHFARNRVADEIHGVSMISNLEENILRRNEAMSDMRTLMHRHVKPMRIWKLDTDNLTKIANFKTMVDKATEDAENIYIPQDAVEHEIVAVPANATLNPVPWIELLNNQFYQVSGVPQIILGGSSEFTEATAKIAYLAFQQRIEEEQLFVEEQILSQLNLVIELEFPASLENELLSDKAKDGDQSTQPNETTAGSGQ